MGQTNRIGYCEKVGASWLTNALQPTSAKSHNRSVKANTANDPFHLSGRVVKDVRPLYGDHGQLIAYIEDLAPHGYVVISPDDSIEPVLAFSAAR